MDFGLMRLTIYFTMVFNFISSDFEYFASESDSCCKIGVLRILKMRHGVKTKKWYIQSYLVYIPTLGRSFFGDIFEVGYN